MPSINMSDSMEYTIDFSPFLHFLQNHFYINASASIISLGIGTNSVQALPKYEIKQVGYSSLTYSFWMYSYFEENGTKYQVIKGT